MRFRERSRKRFIIADKVTGRYVATVYAERFEEYVGDNSFTRALGGHFWIGNDILASVELDRFTVGDSGGRSLDKEIDVITRIKHEMGRLTQIQAARSTNTKEGK